MSRKPPPPPTDGELMEREISEAPDVGAIVAITRAEIDSQIATARAFPRSLTEFKRDALEMACLDEETAQSCIYALPRKDENGKPITIAGASVRFAEIIFMAFGNCISGGRVVAEDGNFIVAQGVYHDLQRNAKTTMEVRRRIVNRFGKKFSADMIGTTGNAAAAIAQRNAILKGVPKAMWMPIYEAARRVAIGDISTVAERRAKGLAWFQSVGVTPEMVCAKLGVQGVDDIGLPEIEALVGIRTAIREGARPEEVFAADEPEGTVKAPTSAAGMGDVASALKAKAQAEPAKQPTWRSVGEISASIQAAESIERLNELSKEINDLPDRAAVAELAVELADRAREVAPNDDFPWAEEAP